MSHPLILVLGGARSGKSRFALALARQAGSRPLMIATAEPGDAEMAMRIDAHQRERDRSWRTIEEPLRVADVLTEKTRSHDVVVIDCLTLWLSNLLMAKIDPAEATVRLLAVLSGAQQPVIIVSNEVGLGIVPAEATTRAFRDAQGRLNGSVAVACTHVYFMAAGLPLTVKPAPEPRPFEAK